MVLCLAMLIGTTFAWFTDSITNSGNKIQAGSLNIGAVAYDIAIDGDKTVTIPGVNGDKTFSFEAKGTDLETSKDPIINDTLWEPGKSNAKLLEVENKGSLAAKVKLDFNVKDSGLQNALWFDFVMVDKLGNVQGKFQKRPMSQLQQVANGVEVKLDANKTVRFVLVYGMNEEAGNEYQGKTFTADVTIKAAQLNKETDGFGNPDYDKDSEYATAVSSPEEFVEAVEKGGTIELKKDITLDQEYLEVKKDLKIVGNGNTLKAPVAGDKKDRVINVTDTREPVTITLNNVNVEGPQTGAYNRGISFYNTGEVNLIMDNCSVSTNYYAINIASNCQDVNVTIKNSTLIGWAALQTHSPNTNITPVSYTHLAMLHLKGDTPEDVFERAKKEIDLYREGGVDAVIVENYYGNYYDMERVLDYLDHADFDLIYGVNCLNVDPMGFELAKKYHATFVQLDSVAGHLKVRDDPAFHEFMKMNRAAYDGYVLGGVRFKYQEYLSGRSLEEDLTIGMTRCDAIVVTRDATGQETSMEKINEFRNIIKDFPLVIGAGVTAVNCKEQFGVGDAAIVGSYFKDTYKDSGDVDLDHVKTLMKAVTEVRESL